jgi:hypothetical protein
MYKIVGLWSAKYTGTWCMGSNTSKWLITFMKGCVNDCLRAKPSERAKDDATLHFNTQMLRLEIV